MRFFLVAFVTGVVSLGIRIPADGHFTTLTRTPLVAANALSSSRTLYASPPPLEDRFQFTILIGDIAFLRQFRRSQVWTTSKAWRLVPRQAGSMSKFQLTRSQNPPILPAFSFDTAPVDYVIMRGPISSFSASIQRLRSQSLIYAYFPIDVIRVSERTRSSGLKPRTDRLQIAKLPACPAVAPYMGPRGSVRSQIFSCRAAQTPRWQI